MMRCLSAAAILLVMSSGVRAQDMPLSQILIDGEGWAKVSADLFPPGKSPFVGLTGPNGSKPTVMIPSADQSTIYAGFADQDFLWAYPLRRGGPAAGSPYCPLRLKQGEKNAPVTALATDAAGRIYAATPAGIQVFDPTGRLCGVIASPIAGAMHIEVSDGELRAWNRDSQFARKMTVRAVR